MASGANNDRHSPRGIWRGKHVDRRRHQPAQTSANVPDDAYDSELASLPRAEGRTNRILIGKQRANCRLTDDCHVRCPAQIRNRQQPSADDGQPNGLEITRQHGKNVHGHLTVRPLDRFRTVEAVGGNRSTRTGSDDIAAPRQHFNSSVIEFTQPDSVCTVRSNVYRDEVLRRKPEWDAKHGYKRPARDDRAEDQDDREADLHGDGRLHK